MINGGYTGEHLVTLSRLQRIWKVYRGCLEYDMEECRECGRFPHVLIMDGTFVGSKKIPKFEQKSGPEKRQIPMNLLRVVPKRDARTHLRRVAERQEVCKPWPDNFEIPAVLKSFIEFAADDSGKLSPEWRPLVLELSAGTASSCILQFHQLTTGEGYRALIEGVNIWTDTHYLKHQDSMLDETPILYKCLFSNKPDVGPFDSRVRKLLSLIYNKSQLIYDEDFLYEHIGPQTPLPPGTPSDHEAFFFWERIHNVPKYEADGDSLAQNLLCSEKRLTKHKQFGHGIMLVTCSHRIIYGFMALPSAESPRHLFEIILKYVPAEHFPEVCVYDNACHAYAYAISREPRLFRNVIMLIDRLHGANHVDCPVAMRLSQYTTHPVLRKINSQACEQNNGRMTGFKGNVPYMNLPTFMETLKLYSYDHNNMILEQK